MMDKTLNSSQIVSVIVPTYNRGYCLGRTIQSVLEQIYTNWELIIVDNHSTDNTDELVASYNDPRIQLLKIHNDGVIAASRNKGLRAARGKYVAFLDSDDWWLPGKLKASVEQLDEGADIVYHDLYLISSYPAKHRFWKLTKTRQVKSPVFHDLLFNGNTIINSSVVVKRGLMEQIGGFSEDRLLVAAEDYDAWLRLAKKTEAFVRLNKPYGYYWTGGGNTSSAERTICNLEQLSLLYQDGDNGTFALTPTYSYTMGKAKYELGCFDEARFNFAAVLSSDNNQNLFFRSLVWWVRSMFKS